MDLVYDSRISVAWPGQAAHEWLQQHGPPMNPLYDSRMRVAWPGQVVHEWLQHEPPTKTREAARRGMRGGGLMNLD